jgi:hypothetical protein
VFAVAFLPAAIPRGDVAITGVDRDKRVGCGNTVFSLDRAAVLA